MAGHSKFKNIQHRKGAQDKKRAKVFGRCAKEIIVATKEGGADPEMNPRLRLAIQTAKANNLPNDNIARAIKTGSGDGAEANNYELMRYEGYGPASVAFIVETLTDNRNRTASDVRSTFAKYGGNLGESNSVSFMFDHVGEIAYALDKVTADQIFEAAVEAGAENVETTDEEHLVITSTNDFAGVQQSLQEALGEPLRAEFNFRPNVEKDLDEEAAEKVLKLIDMLEDLDDVQYVYTNFTISDEIMEKLAG
ncbi:MAG: YebC/PmpR family DNA-binding transcriptional regulator [Micavibrio sp.]|nr:YebC/PmpR family DNA-binding transcriptional regulator [Micavibrio sp.]|tara:strand:+ start:1268 stop:2020 length:753 start_codon:yes stop_codon:yes gene_type:complete